MNERITLLALKASDPKTGWLDRQKFAELIVQECIDIVSDCSVEYCTRPQIVNEIKEHFGVQSARENN